MIPVSGTTQAPQLNASDIPTQSGDSPVQDIMDVLDPSNVAGQDRAEQARQDALVSGLRSKLMYFKMLRTGRYETRWNECYKLYRVSAPDERKSGEWRSKISKPYAFNAVEDILPHYMDGIFGSEKLFRLQSSSESPEMLEAHETLLAYQLTQQIGIEEKYEEGLRTALIYGSCPVYTGWSDIRTTRKQWMTVTSPVDPTLSTLQIKSFEVPDYVGNTFEPLDLWNVYVHPRATRDNVKLLFWEEWRTMEWIKTNQNFKNLDKIDEGMATLPNNMSRAEFRQFETGSGNSQATQEIEKTYRVVTCYDDEAKKVYVMVEDKILIYEDDYPFFHGKCPIDWIIYTPMPKEFYGLGLIETNANLIHMGNTLLNATMDNLQMAMHHMMEVRDGAIEDEKNELVWRPFGIIHSDDGNAVRPLEKPLLPQDVWIREKQLETDINHSTGAGGELAGASTNATGGTAISLRQKGQLMRLEYAIRKAAKTLAKVVDKMMHNNMQFYPVESVKAVLGERMFANWQEYQPDSITITAKVIVEPVGLFADDDVLRQQFTNMVNVLGANPNTSGLLDWTYLAKKTLKLFGESDPNLALKKHGTLDTQEYEFARQENLALVNGEYVPPATPQDDEQIHMEVHSSLAAARPDLVAGGLGQHMLSHNQAVMERQQMMLQAQLGAAPGGAPGQGGQGQPGIQGPGSAPTGARGGVNHNRQPQPSGREGLTRQHARMMGRH